MGDLHRAQGFTRAFVDLNTADEPTYVSGPYKSSLDRVFVPNPAGKAQAAEFADSTFGVFLHPGMTATEYRKRVSDHRMIRVALEVMDDD